MKFPMVIRHRQFNVKIYGKSGGYEFYRLAYYTAGKRHVRSFARYGDAKKEAERILRDLADGSQAAALTGPQSRDAIAALQCLETFRQGTGRRVSLLEAASEYVEALSKAPRHTLGQVVDGFKQTVATVQRRNIKEAVEELLQARAPLAKSTNGQAGATVEQIRLQPRNSTASVRQRIPEHRRLRFNERTPRNLCRLAQWIIREEPQPLPRRCAPIF